jgi:hypothetical protein
MSATIDRATRPAERVEEVWAEVVDEHGPEPTAKQTREVVHRHRESSEEPVSAVESPIVRADESPTEWTERRLQRVHAAKRRVETVVGTCQAWAAALESICIEDAAAVSTADELDGWDVAFRDAIAALKAVRKRLPGGE